MGTATQGEPKKYSEHLQLIRQTVKDTARNTRLKVTQLITVALRGVSWSREHLSNEDNEPRN